MSPVIGLSALSTISGLSPRWPKPPASCYRRRRRIDGGKLLERRQEVARAIEDLQQPCLLLVGEPARPSHLGLGLAAQFAAGRAAGLGLELGLVPGPHARHGREDLLLLGGVEQHHADDLVRIAAMEGARGQAAERAADHDIGRGLPHRLEQRVQVARSFQKRTPGRRRIAPAQAGAVVDDRPRERRDQPLDHQILHRRPAAATGFEHHGRTSLPDRQRMQPPPADIDQAGLAVPLTARPPAASRMRPPWRCVAG